MSTFAITLKKLLQEIVINHKNPKEELLNLFMRPLKAE